ncbi:putative nadh-ubiquinone oxidoreductase 12 kda [Phaeomoniella chlamydospora]|uniref:Putative nadh-ubiquinone oxidoreductase 12 kDa n=1 Tax=Phaeomoniella chlamydospora TaxID=158046 RepID=A0A0G2GDI5_PHACM|nr:putative nadh-ubiquinone oxidoreductase 12 kda [Phaeomoniella chlamydospora]
MPTAESAAYLAKKPTVPPTFQDVDFSNNEALVNARDAVVREQWVKIMMARLVREEMGKCYVREGNNHLEKCGRYRERYLQLLSEAKAQGFKGQEQNYTPGVDGPSASISSTYPRFGQHLGSKGTDLNV